MPATRRPWSARLEVTPQAITVVVREPEGDDVLKAVFSGYPDHPRALLTLLEGLALWSGAPLCAAISAAHPVSHSLGVGSFGDLEHWPEESALVSFQFVEPARRRRRIGPLRTEAEILRLYHAEKWRIGTIATQIGVHHTTVRRVLAQAGIAAGTTAVRPSIAEPFIPFIIATLEHYPRLRASRLYEMVRQRGYPGRPDHFRAIVARYRPRPKADAYLRLRTLPGEQGQVDWGHFGTVTIGRATRALMGFVMVLAWSRHVFLRFSLGAHMAALIGAVLGGRDALGVLPTGGGKSLTY